MVSGGDSMNISYERIDNNTFVVVNDKGEEITYQIGDNIENWEIAGYVFLQNELEWKLNKLLKYTNSKEELKLNLLEFKKYIRTKKSIDYKISDTSKTINDIAKNLNRFKTNANLKEVKREIKVHSKNNK